MLLVFIYSFCPRATSSASHMKLVIFDIYYEITFLKKTTFFRGNK